MQQNTEIPSDPDLTKKIDKRIGEVRTEAVDLTFGEIINLHSSGELKIDPEYQRLFRWSDNQKSKLIESLLLQLPIPQIFVMENNDGKYELIDGLQRISSVIQFVAPELINLEALELHGCDLVNDLNGYAFNNLPLALRLQLKRSTVRTVVIKRQSKNFLRYEMFKRLNTGGSLLSGQEIRNCSARLFGDPGVKFYKFLIDLAAHPSFERTTSTLSDTDMDKRGREELVLRFFAAKNYVGSYFGNVTSWLDDYIDRVLVSMDQNNGFILPGGDFDFFSEKATFVETFDKIDAVLGETAFCKIQNKAAIGGLAPAHYEAVSVAFARQLQMCQIKSAETLYNAITIAKESGPFRQNVGAGANNRTKLRERIRILEQAIIGA